ncbi:phosphoribosylanthranilate isomerase [uncultured Eubacterium sp.]|uniref:phosphoribosylanthranilate isomerase n=1 Tax=uncultured Eubacterium sp. TaxID=165185 RepID=UPI0015AA21E9|nr:phosphoribosylanthranilate isomerase [uncultured Eubacterium sp.]
MAKVKICGLSRPEDIEAVNAYGADYAGVVFFEKSKRNVGYEKAEKLLRQLKKNPNIQSVAVCVSPSKEEVKRLNDMGFDLIQIHGTIPADCQSDGGLALWQAVNISGSSDVNAEELFVQAPNISGYVVDGAEYGSGKTFGWEAEEKTFVFPEKLKRVNRQFVLAGGLNIENVQNGICMLHPDVVDVSSGVERNGVKDTDLIRKFITAVKQC